MPARKRAKGEGRYDRDPLRPEKFLAPSDREFRLMLTELIRKMGRKEVLQMMTTQDWIFGALDRGARKPSPEQRRLVWLLWVILLHPERLRSKWDLLTWGFYHRYPIEWKGTPEDWSI